MVLLVVVVLARNRRRVNFPGRQGRLRPPVLVQSHPCDWIVDCMSVSSVNSGQLFWSGLPNLSAIVLVGIIAPIQKVDLSSHKLVEASRKINQRASEQGIVLRVLCSCGKRRF